MCRSPGTAAIIPQVVAQAECIDFLLYFFQGHLMVVMHADIFLDLFILVLWNIHRAVIMVRRHFAMLRASRLSVLIFFFPLTTGIVVGARMTQVI